MLVFVSACLYYVILEIILYFFSLYHDANITKLYFKFYIFFIFKWEQLLYQKYIFFGETESS